MFSFPSSTHLYPFSFTLASVFFSRLCHFPLVSPTTMPVLSKPLNSFFSCVLAVPLILHLKVTVSVFLSIPHTRAWFLLAFLSLSNFSHNSSKINLFSHLFPSSFSISHSLSIRQPLLHKPGLFSYLFYSISKTSLKLLLASFIVPQHLLT